MKKILFVSLFAMLASTPIYAQSLIKMAPNAKGLHSVYLWDISEKEDIFELKATGSSVTILVSVNASNYLFNPADSATITCDGQEYTVLAGNALSCYLSANGVLSIQDKNFKNGASGTYEVL